MRQTYGRAQDMDSAWRWTANLQIFLSRERIILFKSLWFGSLLLQPNATAI